MSATPSLEPPDRDVASCQAFLDTLSKSWLVLSIKLYRLKLDRPPAVPTLPCLDHEAKLYADIPKHMAAYIEEPSSGDLHELIFTPADERIEIDIVSTMGEHASGSQKVLLETLMQRFPEYTVEPVQLSWLGDEDRVARTCRAQVTLREVLLGKDLDDIAMGVGRLETIATLMDKESRVASRMLLTVMLPLLAAAVFLTDRFLGMLTPSLGTDAVMWLRYTIIAWLGIWFLYYGLKTAQLARMANRVWKRSAEYGLILKERRLRRSGFRDT